MSGHNRGEASIKRHFPAAGTLALGGCRAAQARMAAPKPAVGGWPTRVAVLGDALKDRLAWILYGHKLWRTPVEHRR